MIYLDNSATTKVHDKALEIVNVYSKTKYFNPSALYKGAIEVGKDIISARKQIANCLDCESDEVFFNSGGSEANNTAIFGAVKNTKGNIITTKGEHLSVYAPIMELKNRGFEIRFANLNAGGKADIKHIEALADNNTVFASIIHAGNETGAVNDIKTISAICKAANPSCIVHSDGVQAYLKRGFSVKSLGVDMYSISGHKVHCPKGIGALYIKKGLKINPVIYGGEQESGTRAGTENTANIIAFGEVSEILYGSIQERAKHCKTLKDSFISILNDSLSGFIINSNGSDNLENILSISIEGVKSDIIIQLMSEDGIYLSSGSACSARSKISRVLKELNVPKKYLEGSVRISFSQYNTLQEIQIAAEKLANCVKGFRRRIG